MSVKKDWWVYIIQTDKGQFYTGITTDIERRWQEHCDVSLGLKTAKGAKFFRSQSPERMVYKEQHESRSAASSREAEIKAMKVADKKQLWLS